MKKFFKVASLAVIMVSSSLVCAAQEAQKIAVVFPAKIMQQSPQNEKIQKKLEAEFKERIAELQTLEKEITDIESKLERDSEFMQESEVTSLKRQVEVKLSEFNLKRKAFAQDTRRRKGEEQQRSWAVIHNVIQTVASKNGFDAVLNGEQLFFAKPELDISDIVIKELSKK